MNYYDVKRLALINAVMVEVEGMKIANNQEPTNPPFKIQDFIDKSAELQNLAYANDEQL